MWIMMAASAFSGHKDDVINVSIHRIGIAEVENALESY